MATYLSLKSLLAVFCLFALAPALQAQSNTSPNEVPAVTRTILLQNAQVVQAPGQVFDRTSVLIRDGLIEAVGADLAVPFDARVIAADSFRVYAGFIDGLSHTGVPKPKPGETPDIDDPGNPPPDAAGIQPQRDVRTMMDLSEKSIEALRNAGFTTAHVVPHGNLFPGQGAIVNLAGSNVGQMVLAGEASMFSQFEAARRMYPATDLGMMALWRNLYRQADRRQQRADRFSDRPGGLNRPEYDAVRYAFFPVVSGEQPVAFKTESYLDAKRALRLQEELGFQLLLMELKEGWWLTEELADTPVFLSLD
ncbi:MAG: amidohydrolase, partial [Bacteroidota bacterium]